MKEFAPILYETFTPEIQAAIKTAYEEGTNTLAQIGLKYGLHRDTISRNAKRYSWHRKRRTEKNRTIYRKLATQKLGRPLILGEHVHHIDGDSAHNFTENLHVFPNSRTHQESHKSIERCAFELFKRGEIFFDHSLGIYKLKN